MKVEEIVLIIKLHQEIRLFLFQIFFGHALGYIWRRHFKNTEKAGNSNILQLQQRSTTAAELLTAAATEKKLQLQH